jgi:hypothetical protein
METRGVALPRTRGGLWFPPYSLPAFLKRKRRLASAAGRLSLCRPSGLTALAVGAIIQFGSGLGWAEWASSGPLSQPTRPAK